jgi:hypothetical protein
MSKRPPRGIVLACALLGAVVLGGCRNPDALTATRTAAVSSHAPAPASPGEPRAPGAPSAASQIRTAVQRTPQAALEAFAERYTNWTYRTLTAQQRALGAMSVGAARLAEQQAAASAQGDSTIARAHVHNSGRVVSIGRDLTDADKWVVVTRERTGGNSNYQGLPAGLHVTLSELAWVPGGYAVSQWLPQS